MRSSPVSSARAWLAASRTDAASGQGFASAPAAPRGPLRQPGFLPAAHGDPAPGQPGDRAIQGERRPDRGDADQLTPLPRDAGERRTHGRRNRKRSRDRRRRSRRGGEALAGDTGDERILNQDEIDSLLGFDLSDEEAGERTGIRAIINSALVSYERLPMLEIVFDRLVRLMTTSLRNSVSYTH